MMKRVIFAWLSIATLVATNPMPQTFPDQQYASYNNPCAQLATVQNQAPPQSSLDGTVMSELLMNKILKNPCLQKILDPNTKLLSQNGRQVQRQPNSGANPSVVNNYFIVPPEFFSLNSNKTEEKSSNVSNVNKKRKNSNKKANVVKNDTEIDINKKKERDHGTNGMENNKSQKNNPSKRVSRRKKHKSKPAKIIQSDATTDSHADRNEQDLKSRVNTSENKNKKKRRKPNIGTSPVRSGSESDTTGKRQKKTKTSSNKIPNDAKNETIDTNLPTEKNETSRNISTKNKSESYLKNIESPIDNNETKNNQENGNSAKSLKEIRETRKSKEEPVKTNKQAQSNNPISEDMLKNFYPFMNNNFYSNGNYPFNFEQFYQPYVSPYNHNSNKTSKHRNIQNKLQKKDPETKVVEVKLKSKKHENTTTVKPLPENYVKIDENQRKVDRELTKSTESDKPSIDTKSSSEQTLVITDDKKSGTVKPETLTQQPDETKVNNEKEPNIATDSESLKQNNVVSKTNLEMPPTMIEDLHQYITPELGNEDIVPTIHTNGIIDDYFPIFYNDPHYNSDESYHLKDFDDDRHFYTTDRGFDEPLSRDRRKYERYEDLPINNRDVKDRINYRRTYKLREKDKEHFATTDKSYVRRLYPGRNSEKEILTHDFDIKNEDMSLINDIDEQDIKQDFSAENQFQTPPLLEHPDFKTTKIDKIQKESEIDTYEVRKPIYMSMEKITDYKHDPKPIQYSRLINYESDATKDDIISTNSKPESDTIETVFAKTRVMKYGVTKDEGRPTSLPQFDKDGKEFYSDGQTTYVVAKSLANPDDCLW